MLIRFRASQEIECVISPTLFQDFNDGSSFKLGQESLTIKDKYNFIDKANKIAVVMLEWRYHLPGAFKLAYSYQYNVDYKNLDNSQENASIMIVGSMTMFVKWMDEKLPKWKTLENFPDLDKEKIANLRDRIIERLKKG